jgi:putative FmdB family regulatory protein
MPLYEYECEACGQRFEMIRKFSDAPLEACRLCGKGPVEKLLSSPAIQFKGEGWYITDYARKGKKDDGKRDDGKKDDGAKESGPSAKGTSEGSTGSVESSGSGESKPAAKASETKKSDSGGTESGSKTKPPAASKD